MSSFQKIFSFMIFLILFLDSCRRRRLSAEGRHGNRDCEGNLPWRGGVQKNFDEDLAGDDVPGCGENLDRSGWDGIGLTTISCISFQSASDQFHICDTCPTAHAADVDAVKEMECE